MSLQKGPSDSEMGQWCLSSNAWSVCSVRNQIWYQKDFQRGKSTLYGVIFIISWFPLYCGSTCALRKNDETEVFIRPTRTNPLCGYPFVKMELEIQARFPPQHPFSCCIIISDRNIWRLPAAQFHFWYIFGYELNTETADGGFAIGSVSIETGCRKDVNKIVGTSWTLASKRNKKFWDYEKK